MKKTYLLFLLFLSCFTFSQNIEVRAVVLDSITKEPVISASVAVKGTALGTITNEDGTFQMNVDKEAKIIIAYLGYKKLTINASSLNSEKNKILLVQDQEILEEVVVSKIPIYTLLHQVISATTERLNKPVTLRTYFREFSKNNGKYNKFSDGLLDYYISSEKKKLSSSLMVQQNRSVNLLTPEEEEKTMAGSFINVKSMVISSYSVSYIYKSLIDKKNYENYDFELKIRKDKQGNEQFLIAFSPKESIKAVLLEGYVLYDPNTKLIAESEVYFAPSHQQYSATRNILIVRFSYLDLKMKTVYKFSGDVYSLAYSSVYNKLRVFNNRKINQTVESRSDVVVTNITQGVKNLDNSKLFSKRHLSDIPSNFNQKFWLNNNAIVLTSEEEKVVADLEKDAVNK